MDLPKRIQGTDGVRGVTWSSAYPIPTRTDPVELFLTKGLLSEDFVELYCYCYVRLLEQKRIFQPGQEIVIGWDPRDRQGSYGQAAIRGARKAGARVLSLGIMPTPAIPLYLLYRGAAAGIMITASHNPPDQNGIKLFHRFLGLKPLPADDEELTRLVYDTPFQEVSTRPLIGTQEEASGEALQVWYRFFESVSNTWLEEEDLLRHLIVVVDPAYGCLRGIAAEILGRMGVGQVIEVNNDPEGEVNVHAGVASLEGTDQINARLEDPSGKSFQDYQAVETVLDTGRRYRDSLLKGERWVVGLIFDADGDRFYRLDYDPWSDRVLVLTGDEIAYHQASYLMSRFPDRLRGAPYINTVESDLNVSVAAAKLGYSPHIEAVGDKWLLIQSIFSWLEAVLPPEGKKSLSALRERGTVSIMEIKDLLPEDWSLVDPAPKGIQLIEGYSIGSEASGHAITPGIIKDQKEGSCPVFIGNGLKSAINTLVATESLYRTADISTYLEAVYNPYPKGFQKTLYVYYTDKARLRNGSYEWKLLEGAIKEHGGYSWERRAYPHEPDMLYMSGADEEGQRFAVFIRNSGTEDKTGISLRGNRVHQGMLLRLGESLQELLYRYLKDRDHAYARAEREVLDYLARQGPCQAGEIPISLAGIERKRLLNEIEKQGLIRQKGGRVFLSELGERYLKADPPLISP